MCAKISQAVFASSAITLAQQASVKRRMAQKRRLPEHRMEHLRAWRDSLGLSRQTVVERIAAELRLPEPIDQAALAKWEKGEVAVKVEDIEILAKIYGVDAPRLFFPPGDERTPALLKRAHDIIVNSSPEAVARWLAMGEILGSDANDKSRD